MSQQSKRTDVNTVNAWCGILGFFFAIVTFGYQIINDRQSKPITQTEQTSPTTTRRSIGKDVSSADVASTEHKDKPSVLSSATEAQSPYNFIYTPPDRRPLIYWCAVIAGSLLSFWLFRGIKKDDSSSLNATVMACLSIIAPLLFFGGIANVVSPATSITYLGEGYSYYTAKNYELSAIAYQRALNLDPQSAEANYGVARALKHMGRRDETNAASRRFLALPDAHDHLGRGDAQRWIREGSS